MVLSLVPSTLEPASARRLASLLQHIAAGASQQDLLGEVAEIARSAVDAASVAIGLQGAHAGYIEIVAAAADTPRDLIGMRILSDESLAGQAMRTGEPAETSYDEAAQHGLPRGVSSAAAAPILGADGSVRGAVLALNKHHQDRFDQADVDCLRLMASAAALVLHHEQGERAMRDQRRELDVLYEAVRTISGSLNIQEVLASVLDAVCARLEHHSAVLLLLNDDRTHLFIAAERGLTDDERDVQLSASGGMAGRAIEDRRPWLIADCDLDPGFESIASGAPTRSAILAPIASRTDVLGLVIVSSLQPHAYSANDVQLLDAVAAQAGIAIENAWLYEDATRRAEEAAALHTLSQHLNSSLDLGEVYRAVCTSAAELLNVDGFAVQTIEPGKPHIYDRAQIGVNSTFAERPQAKLGEGISGWVCEWMTPTAVADVAADSRNRSAPIEQFGVTSVLCVPMTVGGECLGALLAMSGRRRLFTVAEMELLYTIANHAAVAIQNARLYRNARDRSVALRGYFRRAAQALGTLHDHDSFPMLTDLAVRMLDAQRAVLYRVSEAGLELVHAQGFRQHGGPEANLAAGDGLAGSVVRRGKAVRLLNPANDPRYSPYAWLARDRIGAYLGVPLRFDEQVVAVLEVFRADEVPFSKDDAKLLAEFARGTRLGERTAGDRAGAYLL